VRCESWHCLHCALNVEKQGACQAPFATANSAAGQHGLVESPLEPLTVLLGLKAKG
jgi:hypothetical protein